MKTLVPPPITKDWRPSESREGLLKLRQENDGGEYFTLSRWYVQDDTEASANFRFFGASPAMAEALANLLEFVEDLLPIEADPLLESARSALLAAGYTEAADQE